ncbi:hypothetical protein [Bordetella petrii]|uniref:hypothetical protein n=1 Tax=Bordetella petrii TaxID=94624 RepID=UPI001E2F7CD6|nr:hypothetical protein [Bordetella petrii]MCD0501502.1 hypothetical protein [Bordetella petrii]
MPEPDLIKDVKDSVNEEIEALGPDATPEQIADIVAEQAQAGADGNTTLANEAADRARDLYGRGADPDTAAAASAAQAHQDVVAQRPDVQTQGQQLLDSRSPDNDGAPTPEELQNYTGVDPGDQRATVEDLTKSLQAVNAPPGLVPQAQLAVANAVSGGTVLPTGLDIHGNLKVTVHDYVKLDFKNSQIKTTLDKTTYVHKGDVTINAKNVRLTADEIVIEPLEKEINRVQTSKESYRKWLSVSLGLSTTTTTTVRHYSLFGASGSVVPTVNLHIAPLKVGAAVWMNTRGFGRDGIKAATYENTKSMSRTSNSMFLLASVMLIFF